MKNFRLQISILFALACGLALRAQTTPLSGGTGVATDATITFTDITTNNSSVSKHGFLPKLSGSASDVLKGDGTFGAVSGTGTVTHTLGALTLNALVLGNAAADTQTVAGFTTDGVSILMLGVAGSSVGTVAFKNATSGTASLLPPTGALGTFNVTLPNAASTLPIYGAQITYTGPSAPRTVTYPDASFTVARKDAAQTFTGVQSFTSPDITTSLTSPSTTFALLNVTPQTINAFANATTINIGNASGTTNLLGSLNLSGSASGIMTLNGVTSGKTIYTTADATAQTVTVTTAAQTVGPVGLSIPNFAGVNDTYTFNTLAATLANKTLAAPVISTGLTASGSAANTFAGSSGTFITSTGLNTLSGATTLGPGARATGIASYWTVTTPADTNMTASTESIGANWAAATRQWATGALTTQREHVYAAPTYGFVGASTLTTAVNVDIADPIAGTNATLTNKYGLRVNNQQVTGTLTANTGTNLFGAFVDSVDGTTPLNNINQVVAAGTAYTMTNAYASIAFGTTSPILTIANAGTYAVYVDVQLNLVGATYASYDSATIKLRRTNNTAADLAGSTFGTFIPTITTITAIGPYLHVGPIKYQTTNTNDTITVQGVLGTTPAAGSVTATACTITAIRAY